MSKAKVAETVHVALGDRSYDIFIGRGLLDGIHELLPFDLKGRSLFILTDDHIAATHGERVRESLKEAQPRSITMLSLPPGEQTKCFAALESVVEWMLENAVDRDSVLFTVGGGVIGDLGGFAASVVMRGISFVQVPTTLLAQVDSSVGGKTGINTQQGKNLAGAFYQPCAVICDTAALQTLPHREILAGYAETVKYGLINDPEFFYRLEKEGAQVCQLAEGPLEKAVATACRKKAEIVTADEREKDIRALLNLGHTFGHALEGAAGYDGRLLHGEAVAIGMVLAFELSARLGFCAAEDVARVRTHFRDIGLPVAVRDINPPLHMDVDALLDFMTRDKKVSMGRLAFIVVNGIGKARVSREIDLRDVAEILNHSMDGT